MTFEETYQKYLDESDPDRHPSMESLFKWFFDAGRSDGISKRKIDPTQQAKMQAVRMVIR